jgi:hypothetical protein
MDSFKTIVTQCIVHDNADKIDFNQYVGNSTITHISSLLPGDILIDIESKTVSYIGINNKQMPWTSLGNSLVTRHPLTIKEHILVPIQLRYSWLPLDGYAHWSRQALLSNPKDDLNIFIERMKLAAINSLEKGYSTVLDSNANSTHDISCGNTIYLLHLKLTSQYIFADNEDIMDTEMIDGNVLLCSIA